MTRPLRSGADWARLDRLADDHGDPYPSEQEPDYRTEPLQQILEQQNEQADVDVLPCGFYAGEHAFANPRCGCEPEAVNDE